MIRFVLRRLKGNNTV